MIKRGHILTTYGSVKVVGGREHRITTYGNVKVIG
jgi:hypothetical protein